MSIIPNNITENLTEAQVRRMEAFDRAMFITPLAPPPAQLAARIMQAARARAQLKGQPAITRTQLAFLVAASAALLVGLMAFVAVQIFAQGGWHLAGLARLFATIGQDVGVFTRATTAVLRAMFTKPIVWLAFIGLFVLAEASFASVLGLAFARNKK